MDALLLLSLWSLHKSASSMWISTSLDLGFYSACLASVPFDILWIDWRLWQASSALWRPLNPTLALAAHDIHPGMDILISLFRFSHIILHTPSLFLWILLFHPIWVLMLHTRLCCLHGYPLHPCHLVWPTMHHDPLSWMPVLKDLTELLFEELLYTLGYNPKGWLT